MPTLLEDEALEFVRDLIRIETVNTGVAATIGDGETRAARWVQERLAEVGIASELVESRPGRGSLVARLPGAIRMRARCWCMRISTSFRSRRRTGSTRRSAPTSRTGISTGAAPST